MSTLAAARGQPPAEQRRARVNLAAMLLRTGCRGEAAACFLQSELRVSRATAFRVLRKAREAQACLHT